MKTIMLVFGIRPEAIKMYPQVKEWQGPPKAFQKCPEEFHIVTFI